MESGKSKSLEYPNGLRKMIASKEMAPRSARRKGKMFMSECTESDLKNAEIIRS